jgi:hypothetical protein
MYEPLLDQRVAVVTGAVVSLACELSSYVTATVIEVGGGRYM